MDGLEETISQEAPGLLVGMNRALNDGDTQAFSGSSHSLKSNLACFGIAQ
jgi:hypothetical protein